GAASGPELGAPLRRKRLRQRKTGELLLPIAGQPQPHGLGPQQGVRWPPRLGCAEDDEFGGAEPPARRDPGVHAARVGFQYGAIGGGKCCFIGPGAKTEPPHAHLPIESPRLRPPPPPQAPPRAPSPRPPAG